ncbi:membrane hypothetical protein [uncultured Desulfobacterium sp.]|uniref:Uncharacterized protein n=1 Tax=uncultured Desulfobacterium sp. TaxID=201089 RepID=A0A445MSB1_9BACT|nr:membrane hypothetical protein [uncultured Desulfobacterium sp.]
MDGRLGASLTSNKAHDKALRQWILVALFAIAFAWVEAAVVVYLRHIYYNGSFSFPIVVNWKDGRLVGDPLMYIEYLREAATIIMLAAIGLAAGKKALQRFCLFIVAFGLWDIFYYIWLRVMTGWPDGLLTWDILFLLPLPWVGPVITPVAIALAMIVAGSLILYLEEKGHQIKWSWYDWCIEMTCGLIMVIAFCWDWKNIIRLPAEVPYSGIPNPFAWWLFLPSLVLSLAYFVMRLKKVLTYQVDRPKAEN